LNRNTETTLPPLRRSLSARLLLFTILFVMLSEVLIYVPSIARFRQSFLLERANEAHLATLALDATSTGRLEPELEQQLLHQSGVLAVELWRPMAELMLGGMPKVDASYELDGAGAPELIRDAFLTMAAGGKRTISVITPARGEPGIKVEIFLREENLFREMVDYSWRILNLSIVISLITAGLVYATLQWLMVRPMRRLTLNLVGYRKAPEDPARVLPPTRRGDEIGVLQRELARMQSELRQSLAQKTRLAALGTAVSKITHDLRGILNSADLIAERLQRVDDPGVKRVTPLLVGSLDRAVELCTQTLDLARGDQAVPQRHRFPLLELLQEVGASLEPCEKGDVHWALEVEQGLEVEADYDRLYRVFMNLGRNAVRAMDNHGTVRIEADTEPGGRVRITFSDDGPGIPDAAREHLFTPFAGAASAGGTGLGLATARDLVRAHGGDLILERSGPDGTSFRIVLPAAFDGAPQAGNARLPQAGAPFRL